MDADVHVDVWDNGYASPILFILTSLRNDDIIRPEQGKKYEKMR